MSGEQNILGVPEGHRIVRVRKMKEYVGPYFEAIIERIPKPKKRVLVAEWDVAEGEGAGDATAWVTYADRHTAGRYCNADRTRVEERDDDA